MSREVKVMVRRGDEFLVLLRCEADGGYWHVVAGGVEPDETYAQAARRELREEIGLVAEPGDLARSYVYHVGVVVHASLVDVPDGGEPTPTDEHDEYRWCSPPDAAARLHWPETRELVSEL